MVRYHNLFRAHFRFIINSCELYDNGAKEEALRLAISFRVLFYDTSKSTSLLKHLGIKKNKLQLHDSMGGFDRDYGGKPGTQIYINVSAMYSQNLNDLEKIKEPKLIPWKDWWNNIVFATNAGLIDRKLTMLSLANQDGGAHVEIYEALPESYRKFLEGNWMIDGKTKKPLGKNAHLDVIRNMANELLISPDMLNIYNDPESVIKELKSR